MGFLLKELDLDKSQSIKFRKSGQSHRLEKERLEKELINQKASLVAAIMDTNEQMKDSLRVIIGELNQENEQLMIDHFTALSRLIGWQIFYQKTNQEEEVVLNIGFCS
jgi:hypothetical protein